MKRCFSMSGHGVSDVDGDRYLASSDTDDPDTYRRGALTQAISEIENWNLDTVKEK
jgi:uncharacterized caspase-like protein